MAKVLGYIRDPLERTETDGSVTSWWDKDRDVSVLLAAAPPKLTTGDVDLRPFCTDTNQAELSSCAGNATADAVEVVSAVEEWHHAKAENRKPRAVPQLSRLFVYGMSRTLDGTLAKDEGTFIRSCFKVLGDFGIPEEKDWPYDATKVFTSPSILAQRAALGHRIHSYYRIKSTGQARLDAMVAALRAMKPVVFGTLIDDPFQEPTGSMVVDRPKGKTIGGHAMLCVGYIAGKFLVKNSWGPTWRDRGYALFTPEYMAWENTWDVWVPTLGF